MLLLSLLLALGCASTPPARTPASTGVQPLERPAGQGGPVRTGPVRHVSTGQVVYVPCYSYIYLQEGRPYNLSITLSIRNTSPTERLVVESVEYHDSTGAVVKRFDEHHELGPLASGDFFVREDDPSGGSGAAFIVRWVAETQVPDPVVQAVMVGTAGSQGVSFITEGRVLEELGPPSPRSNSPLEIWVASR